jgi:hypothetical protein
VRLGAAAICRFGSAPCPRASDPETASSPAVMIPSVVTDSPELIELHEMAQGLGYSESHREEHFPAWAGGPVVRADLACFADPDRHDMATATVVAGVGSGDRAIDRHVQAARALAAPVCVVRDVDNWRVLAVGGGDQTAVDVIDGVRPDRDPQMVRFLAPRSLLAAKRADRQLALFPVDVGALDRSRGRAGAELDQRVRDAVAQLLPNPDTCSPEEAEDAARLVVQSLTALAVRDKIAKDGRLDTAVALVQEHLPEQGDLDQQRIASTALVLGEGLSFRGLDAGLLGDVYERAILVPSRRLDLGAYYTPPELGRRIIANLPFEEVPPDERRVLDPSCGSGTLLLAANDRLADALPHDETGDKSRREYARDRLFGADKDPFAVELARLGLFLQALPYGNGFHVRQGDALQKTGEHPVAPTFVVTNPPWRFRRSDGQREQRADHFLQALVRRAAPGGFIAIVLPASWLTDDTSRAGRAWLRQHTEVFEVWRLPRNSFRTADLPPCVLFARVGNTGGFPLLYRNVWPRTRGRFFAGEPADETLLVDTADDADVLTAGPLDAIGHLRRFLTLRDVALVRNGPPTDSVNDVGRHGGPLYFLRRYADVRPFGKVTDEALIRCRYPEDFSRPITARPDEHLGTKVLASAMTSPDTPWRLRVVLDEIGVIARNSLYAVTPKENTHTKRLALMGILGSGLASLWVASRSATRMVKANTLRALPVPDERHWPDIAEATSVVLRAVEAGGPLDEHVRNLEVRVCAAYELSQSDVAILRTALAGTRSPEGVVRYEAEVTSDEAAGEPYRAAGSTLDAEDGRVRLHIPGVTSENGDWMQPPGRIPGWLARPGATFEVEVSAGPRDWQFRFQHYAWMSGEDLFDEFE